MPRSVISRGGRLEFRGISSEDQGRYTCSARNQVGSFDATAEVVVSSDSLNFDSVEEIPARFASDVDLYCRLSGQGPMRWERPDGRPLNRANQFPNGRLRIQNVQPQDAGVYLCIRGDQTQYVRLKVETGKKLIKIDKMI